LRPDPVDFARPDPDDFIVTPLIVFASARDPVDARSQSNLTR